MSKLQLKKYLADLDNAQLQEQVVDLYERFKAVKTYYDFVFNPKEEKLIADAKERIGKEYFPIGRRKAKLRRSVAHKLIKHFIQLQIDPQAVLDVMLFNIETAQAYCAEKPIKPEAFYKSMLKSIQEANDYGLLHGIKQFEAHRFNRILDQAQDMEWINRDEIEYILAD